MLPLEKLLQTTRSESIKPQSIFRDMDRKQSIFKKDFQYQFQDISINLLNRCKEMVYNGTMFDICTEQLGKMEPIKSIVKYTLGLGYYIVTKPLCNLAINSIADVSCTKYQETFQNLTKKNSEILDQKAYKDLEEMQKYSKFIQPADMLLEIWPTIAEFKIDLMDFILASVGWLQFLSFLIDICLLILYFFGLFNSILYHYYYLHKLNFDNYYVNRYFRKKDRERQNMKKVHLLPLSGKDQMNLISTFQLKRNFMEKNLQMKRNKILFIAFGLMIILIIVTIVITDIGNLLANTLTESNHVEVFIHRFQSRTIGEGFFSRNINELLEKLHFNYTRNFHNEWNHCARLMLHLNWFDLINIIYQMIIITIIHLSSTYLSRTRHLICDFFYYRHSKRRTLFLYNQLLLNRKRLLNKQKVHTENFIKGWYH